MTPSEIKGAAQRAGTIAHSVARILSLVGGLAAFGYGALAAIGYTAPVSTGVRLGRLEQSTAAFDSESRVRDSVLRFNIDQLRMGQDSIVGRLNGLTRVSCLNLRADVRIYLADCVFRVPR